MGSAHQSVNDAGVCGSLLALARLLVIILGARFSSGDAPPAAAPRACLPLPAPALCEHRHRLLARGRIRQQRDLSVRQFDESGASAKLSRTSLAPPTLSERRARRLACRRIAVSGLQCLVTRPPLRSAGARRQAPRLRCIAPRIAAGADTLTADRWPVRRRLAGLPPGVTAVPASEALQLVSWMLSSLFRRYD